MKRCKREAWRGFTDHQAMSWAISAYLAAAKAMDPNCSPDVSDFAERFIGELEARLYLHGWRTHQRIELETCWNLPMLAAFIDPAFSLAEVNNLPEAVTLGDTLENGGLRGG